MGQVSPLPALGATTHITQDLQIHCAIGRSGVTTIIAVSLLYLSLYRVALKSSCWINGHMFMCHSVFCNMGRRRFSEIRKRLSSVTVTAGLRSILFSMSYSSHRHPSLASQAIVSRTQAVLLCHTMAARQRDNGRSGEFPKSDSFSHIC